MRDPLVGQSIRVSNGSHGFSNGVRFFGDSLGVINAPAGNCIVTMQEPEAGDCEFVFVQVRRPDNKGADYFLYDCRTKEFMEVCGGMVLTIKSPPPEK